MNRHVVFRSIGSLLVVLAACLVVPALVSLCDPPEACRRETAAFGATIVLLLAAGWLLRRIFPRTQREIGHTEGLAIVSLGWSAIALFGCLPFLLTGTVDSFVDAFFETMSGFTTTGATILRDVEALPRGILMWRSLSHWLGGMGIVLLSVAILPALGAGGSQLFRAEVPGIVGDRLTPRIAETAKLLWKVYVLFTVLEILLLCLGGMDLFESVCHTFGTMATGGFSVKNASIGHYRSPYIEWVVIVFMFLAGCNFVLHFQALRGRFASVLRNSELRVYTLLLILVTVLLTAFLLWRPPGLGAGVPPPPRALGGTVRAAAFQAVSIITTTGYGTEDFDAWPDFCRLLLLAVMFVGGCSGSTGGSMKVGRVMILFKVGAREVRRLVRPLAVLRVRLDDEVLEPRLVENVVAFSLLFLGIFVAGTLGILALESWFQTDGGAQMDLLTASSGVAATLGNVGPGLGGVGATHNYAWLSPPSKLLLSLCMLLGRLEIYCVLAVFAPRLWRR